MKYVSYLRVSTQKQGNSGLGLEAQRSAVRNYIAPDSIQSEYIEIESGKKNNRIQLQLAVQEAKDSGATLIIAKLDRLARNVAFIATLMESGVEFVAVDNPTANKFTLHIFAALAEQEADMISHRTKAALKAKKERGEALGTLANFHEEGRAKGRATMQQNARSAKENIQAAKLIRLYQAQGWTTRRIAEELNKSGYRTRRGKEFTSIQVSRLSKV